MNSLPMLLVVAFFLGIAGTVFAVGIPFSSAWYDASKKGFATGVFGAGMVGTAISAFATPRLVQGYWLLPDSRSDCYICAVTAAISFFFLKDSPATIGREVTPLMPKIVQAFKVKTTCAVLPLRCCVRCVRGILELPAYLPEQHLQLQR